MSTKLSYQLTFAFVACGLMTMPACSKDDDDDKKGSSIGAPAVEPPVSRNLPSGLSGAALRLQDAQSPKTIALNALKDLISPSGDFVGVVQRLKKIDERMAELNTRAEESPKACLAADITAKAYDIGGSLPGGQAAGMMFQCQEDVGGVATGQLAFGLTEDSFYLMERSGSLAVLTKAPKDGTGVTVWQVATGSSGTDFMQIKAADGAGFEATVAGTDISGQSGAAPCGLHIKSSGTLIYLKASVASNGCTTAETFCVNGSTLADVDAAECTTAGLTTFALTSLTPELAEAAATDAAAIVAKKITGHIDFTADVAVEE